MPSSLPVAEAASVDSVLNEEVDIIIGMHICAFLAHGYVHRVRRLCRHRLDHGLPSLLSSWGYQTRVRGGYLIHHPTTLMSFCCRPITINVCGLGGSTHPAVVQSSRTLADITGNLTCVVEHVGIEPPKYWSRVCLYRVYFGSCLVSRMVAIHLGLLAACYSICSEQITSCNVRLRVRHQYPIIAITTNIANSENLYMELQSARIVATVTVQRSLLPKIYTATIFLAS
ncbi:hypothetical protein EV702DRAFT_1113044 [Suillus placidus]|uniref:Uncharacterized protein n=1 Tax=Suillus placidus TaxID=48579 RepID=A0A9P6ZT94_9AGAM|nr:hypothetical protein EV702DRAFT_1113044 [Suillus placidus]